MRKARSVDSVLPSTNADGSSKGRAAGRPYTIAITIIGLFCWVLIYMRYTQIGRLDEVIRLQQRIGNARAHFTESEKLVLTDIRGLELSSLEADSKLQRLAAHPRKPAAPVLAATKQAAPAPKPAPAPPAAPTEKFARNDQKDLKGLDFSCDGNREECHGDVRSPAEAQVLCERRTRCGGWVMTRKPDPSGKFSVWFKAKPINLNAITVNGNVDAYITTDKKHTFRGNLQPNIPVSGAKSNSKTLEEPGY